MTDGVGPLNGGVHACDCRIDVTEQPQNPRHQRKVGYSGILAGRPGRQSILLAACIELRNRAFDGFSGIGETSHEKPDHSLTAGRIEERWPIAARLGEMK